MRTLLVSVLFVLAGGHAMAQAVTRNAYTPATDGTRWLEAESGLRIKVLVEPSNLGETLVEVGEIIFPAGYSRAGGAHRHQSTEIFYVLSGTLTHVVNGTAHVVPPGRVAIVRAGDEVIHRASTEEVRALVIWAPGGEVERLARVFTVRPIGE